MAVVVTAMPDNGNNHEKEDSVVRSLILWEVVERRGITSAGDPLLKSPEQTSVSGTSSGISRLIMRDAFFSPTAARVASIILPSIDARLGVLIASVAVNTR